MKKLLLGLVSLLSVGVSQKASAQFSIQKDTVAGYASDYNFELDNFFVNNSSTYSFISWKVVYTNLPAAPSQWNSSFGLCDNKNCYANNILDGTRTQTTDTIFPGPASSKGNFHIIYSELGNVTTYGPYYVTIEATDGVETHQATFVMYKYPTSVNNFSKTSELMVYPNPAANDLNVVYGNMDVKTIGVYNLIGKAVSYYRTSGNSAKLDLSAVPSGIYFLRLNDEQGHVLATRKFTKQ
ncbi:MAG: hypothetical protein BGO70_13190 [Bacteroidetes bacterium 43-93]|nr:T9SS type A sorting domain-containing protein [Bacteroidota bacterium]OJW99392.1 MAG: hypothetical protein BGO70_13190 [Bacteroidetes bacterium 43-93]